MNEFPAFANTRTYAISDDILQEMKDFFTNIEFDRIDSFRFNRLSTVSCTQRFDKFEILDEKGEELPNGIIDNGFNLNKTAELVTSTSDSGTIKKLRKLFTNSPIAKPVNPEVPLFKTALLFYRKGKLVNGINISFRQGLFYSIDNKILEVSESDFELFRLFFYADLKHELYEFASYYGSIGENWQRHIFPNSFYFNPHWKSYETSIRTSIISQNNDRVRVEIETNGKKISANQLRKIFYVMNYPIELRNKMNSMILGYYNQMVIDYSLPKLSDEETDSLKYFVKLVGVLITEGDESDILLIFKSWDEEHGLHININRLDQKIEFAF